MKRIERITIQREEDLDDLSWLSPKRKAAFERGDFEMVGIFAQATINVDGVIQTIHSGGLRGIESDSGTEYFTETERCELAQLGAILHQLGFSLADIQAADERFFPAEGASFTITLDGATRGHAYANAATAADMLIGQGMKADAARGTVAEIEEGDAIAYRNIEVRRNRPLAVSSTPKERRTP